jgi:hypothetical protein
MTPRRSLAVSLVLAAALCTRAAAAEIRIATAGPMTGAYAWFGEQYQRGAGLAVADLNATGGVHPQSEPMGPTHDLGEHCTGHRHLGQLENDVSGARDGWN